MLSRLGLEIADFQLSRRMRKTERMTFNIHSCKGVAQVCAQRSTCIKNLKLRQTVLDRVWSSLGIQQSISHFKGAEQQNLFHQIERNIKDNPSKH